MWIKDEAAGSEPVMSPVLALVLVVAVVGTLAMGIYPRPLFELADWSARSLGVVGVASIRP
jgi:NADH:ubiquinone oxidoreductase subunit 2 (subunit N)